MDTWLNLQLPLYVLLHAKVLDYLSRAVYGHGVICGMVVDADMLFLPHELLFGIGPGPISSIKPNVLFLGRGLYVINIRIPFWGLVSDYHFEL